jgi:hypothetical protein
LKTPVYLLGTALRRLGRPTDKMILKIPFVELVEDIGGEAIENIAEGKAPPERVNSAETELFESFWFASLHLSI